MKSADDTIAELFQTWARALRLYARQWTGPAGAEDAIQRVFVRMLDSKRLPDDPKAWLFRCVRNEAISARRSENRRDKRQARSAVKNDAWFVPRFDDQVDAREAEAALKLLPAGQREIITLRIWGGLTLSQIGEVTGLATSTVHDQFRAGLQSLKQHLESPCDKTTQ